MGANSEAAAGGDSQPRNGGVGPQVVGSRVREERLRRKIGVRELARRVGVSASLISQVELGKASPSVGTLYAIVNELGISLDELFVEDALMRRPAAPEAAPAGPASVQAVEPAPAEGQSPASEVGNGQPAAGPVAAAAEPVAPVVRHGARKVIELASDVRWERLTPETPQDVDFLYVTYAPGSESCPANSLMRHSGREYGHVIQGRLGVTIGFETYELGPGDSVTFESSMPHRLFTAGAETTVAIWFVVGRRGDPRIVRNR